MINKVRTKETHALHLNLNHQEYNKVTALKEYLSKTTGYRITYNKVFRALLNDFVDGALPALDNKLSLGTATKQEIKLLEVLHASK